MLDRIPTAWCVKHLHNDKINKFVTVDHARAEQYAAEHHGTLHPLYENLPDPEAVKVCQTEST